MVSEYVISCDFWNHNFDSALTRGSLLLSFSTTKAPHTYKGKIAFRRWRYHLAIKTSAQRKQFLNIHTYTLTPRRFQFS